MESGADNGVLSRCSSARSACWSAAQALTLASADAMALLVREHTAAAHQTCMNTKTLTSITTAPARLTRGHRVRLHTLERGAGRPGAPRGAVQPALKRRSPHCDLTGALRRGVGLRCIHARRARCSRGLPRDGRSAPCVRRQPNAHAQRAAVARGPRLPCRVEREQLC